jgi:hypothetical protein
MAKKINLLQGETQVLPGFGEFFPDEDEPEPTSWDGMPGIRRYFDATKLPDVAGDQPQVRDAYILFVMAPTKEDLIRVAKALTMGERKTFQENLKNVTIDAFSPGRRGEPLIEVWEKLLAKEN